MGDYYRPQITNALIKKVHDEIYPAPDYVVNQLSNIEEGFISGEIMELKPNKTEVLKYDEEEAIRLNIEIKFQG